ncbi:MAG: hypothetical protein II934_01800 [Prevotella sp.]|nr:hypothetical protein [Prevotella sp.]
MRKLKRLVLNETLGFNALSTDAMKAISGGGSYAVHIYSCVCSSSDGSSMYATIKVVDGTDPETAILGANAPCHGYASAKCAYRTTV